jgi:type I restriction enzyme S subunit
MIYGGPPADRIKLASQGSTVGHFNMDDIASMTVLAPPIGEQSAIVDFLAKATRSMEFSRQRAEREVDLLREYRMKLVADVVTGKLDVRETAARLPDEVLEPEQPDAPTEGDEPDEDAVLDVATEGEV